MGRIGEAVARRAVAFGMSIVYTRRGNEEKDSRLKDVYGAVRVSLGELLSRSTSSAYIALFPEPRAI